MSRRPDRRLGIVSVMSRWLNTVEQLLVGAGRGSELVPDGHLAAQALEHGGTVYSQDADFARFRGNRWVDPTA